MHADPDRLRQVLHNLLTNAVEACADRDMRCVAVETRAGDAGDEDMVELTVHDSGVGFHDDIVDRIFEPYVTSKARGTGLGLAIAKKIVEEHGGAVSGNNAPDGGARITVSLPALQGSPEPEPEPPPDVSALRPN